jgi:hypothetical protein
MGPGAAAADYDLDGFTDLFVVRYDQPNQLFRNRGDGTFEDVAAAAGVAAGGLQISAAWGDVDNDGDLDLFVVPVVGSSFLYINQRDGTFLEEAETRGVQLSRGQSCVGAHGASFSDFDHDGDLDLHTTDASGGEYARLYLNDGDGKFTNETETSGLSLGESHFTSTLIDVNGDHWEDYLAVSDFGTSQLYMNQRDGTFVEATDVWHVGTDDSGMGGTAADVNGDGWIDWFVTAIGAPDDPVCASFWGCTGNRMYINTGEGSFEDQTDRYGLRVGGWGWGTAFVDYDLDGDLDLAMVAGYAPSDLQKAMPSLVPSYTRFSVDPVSLWEHTAEMPWREVSREVGFVDDKESKALIPLDYDNDGDLDLFLTNTRAAPALFRNDTSCASNWLTVMTAGTDSNRFGIGAQVYVSTSNSHRPTRRDVTANSTYLGQGPAQAHFGLGSVSMIEEVRVYWPATGRETRLSDVPANQVLVVKEPRHNTEGKGDAPRRTSVDIADVSKSQWRQ